MDQTPSKRRKLSEEVFTENDLLNTSFESTTTTTSVAEMMDKLCQKLDYTPEEACNFIETQIEILESQGKAYKATADSSFKYIFGNENIALLEDLLNNVLSNNGTATKIKLKTAESTSRSIHFDSKTIINDVLATDKEGNTYNFEMQRTMPEEFLNRMLFYSSMQISRSLEKGEPYKSMKSHTIIVLSTKPWIRESSHNFDIVSYKSHKMDISANIKSTWYNVVLCEGALQDEDICKQLKEWIYFFVKGTAPTNSTNQHIIKAADKLDEFFTKNSSEISNALNTLKHSRATFGTLVNTVKDVLKQEHHKRTMAEARAVAAEAEKDVLRTKNDILQAKNDIFKAIAISSNIDELKQLAKQYQLDIPNETKNIQEAKDWLFKRL